MKKYATLFALLMVTLTYGQNKINESWADWANFKKYATQNKEVPQKMNKERRVVFLGNSIFEGWLRSRPEFFAGKPYFDRGISGQTTPQMLLRFYEDVLALNPDVMVLKAGINDIAQNTGPYDERNTLNNIKAIAQLARANGIKVILCSVLPAFDFPWRPGLQPAEKVISLNRGIQSFCDENKFFYLDLFSAVVDERNGMKAAYASDGIHPTVEGYKILEPLVEEAIKKVKK